ncbi:electron transport complex subunit RsxC [Gallionella capsiferriformans]|uniref:Ion-translocating oxidoreductase complex subunit C n=1 Tax=Gallionella capsiferriformans (strain ES-2) TaxID=395494 RepID=D9SJH9_GALCS|nr:electron transport complex subunit RsxC [Gallionella capsiferriformans]ADL56367.1 electron transport complex, RnfABCDGE type, C subunit [Gallionella capsiferriformans ES-2]
MRTLYQFHGGIHPPTNKTQSNATPIVQAALPSKLVIPLHQHVGNSARPVVEAGQRVLKGQVIGAAEGHLSSAVHASTSGTIAAIDQQLVAHPSGMPDLCITLIPDGKNEWIACEPCADWTALSHSELRHKLRAAGVVGLGGAVFPSDMKLYSHKQKIKTLVLNGAECEPYITCDDMLMRERAADILQGAEMMRSLLYAEEVLIGIEDNKPEAIAAMRAAVAAGNHQNMEVIAVPTVYPGGGAKQLIRVLTGIEVAAGVRSTNMGVQCFNVGTAYSAWRAIRFGEPLISRIVTVTGNVAQPKNYEALIGTPMDELVAQAAPLPGTTDYIMGGPMMGVLMPSKQVGVIKATNCIIASSDAIFPKALPALPCIRCTRCAEVCPSELQPQELYWFSKAKNLDKAEDYHLFDCIECGACSYVCPSNIPLVQYYRFAKSEIWARDANKKSADAARERHEFRESRIEREKREKAEKLAAKEKAAQEAKAAVQPAIAPINPDADPENTLQLKIQTAIDHAKEQAAAIKPKNTEQLTPEQQAAIDDIEARRARIRELAKDATPT